MSPAKPIIAIEYCTKCRWLLRAAWYAQEFLTTFEAFLGGVTLMPSEGGTFRIRIQDKVLWDRVQNNGFPDIKQIKQIIRDQVAPEQDLGHTDSHAI